MKKIEIDGSEEIVITVGNLLDIMDGLAKISKGMIKIEKKIDKKESREILIPMVATLCMIARLFPKDSRNEIFGELKKLTGFDAGSLF